MKKIILFALIFSVFGFLYADTYKVISVDGQVSVERNNEFKSIEAGQEIFGNESIKVGLNSSLEVENENGEQRKIKAASRGVLDNLFAKAYVNNKKLRTLKLAHSEIAEAKEGTSKGTATASTRASETKEDVEWNE